MADENIYDEFKEAIPVMSGDTMDIAIDEAFAPIGQSNSELNHAVLNNRDIPNQHPIIAIEGLREELNNIENLKTEYSDEMGFANYYPWEDGGDSKYSRIGYFVTVADRERRIKICTESDEVFGVTVVTAGFIGNQDGIPDSDDYSKYGTKKGSNCGVECGLVAHSGVVNVHCRLDVVKGSHVICDDDGYAKVVPEEDGGYGFKVIGIDWKNGDKYAVISLDASINQLHALGKEALEIRNRMTGLEKNVTTAVNVANQALSKVNEIGEVSQGVAGKVDEIANVVDKNNQQIADTTNKVNQAVQQAQQAQQVAQEISNQVAENAKVEIQQLKDDVSKAQDVANTAKSTAEDAFLAAQNTKNEIQTNINTIIGDTLKENEEYNKTVIEIQDLKASLNKAYKKIKSWNSDDTYTSLDGKENQKSDINTVYYDGTNYYFNDGSWKSTTNISDTGLIASIAGMQEQVDENGAQITSFAKWKGEAAESIAEIEQKANEDGSMIDLLCSYTGDNYEKVKSFNPANNNNDIKKIYYNEADRKFYYYKNGWKSTTKSYEAGITDAIANLKMIANDKESMIQILTTYIGKSVVDAVMCDSRPDLLNMKSGVKYCYQQDESSYICQFTDDKSAYTTYPEDSDLDTISNVVLNAVKEIDNYITVDTWTNDLEDSTEYTKIYYVKGQDKYYHWDTNKSAWLPMEISFYFTYNTDNQCWELTDLTSISFMKAISMIQSRANANGARLDVLLSGDKGDSNSLAAMIAEATGDTALMQMLTQWVDKSGVIEVKDEFDENTADEDKVYYTQGKASELKFLTDNLILMPYDNSFNSDSPSTESTASANGLTFRPNPDGSIDVWGTASATTVYNLVNNSPLTLTSGTYIYGLTTNVEKIGDIKDTSCIRFWNSLNTTATVYEGYPATFDVDGEQKCHLKLQITTNFKEVSSESPVRIYPMINLGSKLKPYTPPRVATTDDKEITLYYYYSNDHWLSTIDPSVAGVSNSLATLKVKSDKHGGEIEGLVKDTGELGTKLSRITQRADGIESLVANIDKYSVGEYSQAYGLSLEQANNILYDGMVFIPTKDTEETYKFAIEELPFDEKTAEMTLSYQLGMPIDSYFESKDKTKCYHVYVKNNDSELEFYFFYNGEKWDGSNSAPEGFKQSFSINRIYQWGDNAAYGCKTWIDTGETALVTTTTTEPEAAVSGQFWYYNGSVPISITNSETGETRELYKPKALYKCVTDETDSTIKYWTFVTSADDNSIARSLSQIRQKSNEIALEVSDAKGSVATLKNTVDNLGAHTALVVDYEGKVKAYMLGDATESGSRWQIGANNINIDGTITVTNTYNTDRKGTFSIYDFAKNRDSSDNYWLRADLADGTTPFSVDETGKLTTTELLVNNCCSTISASSNGISLLVGDKNILLKSECFAGFTPTTYKVSKVTMDPSIFDTYVPSGKYSQVIFTADSTGGDTGITRGIRFVESDILGQSTVDKVKPNTTYTLSFWLKTDSAFSHPGNLVASSAIYAGEGVKVTLDTNRSTTPTLTTSWQKYVLTFKITDPISHFYIMLFFTNCLASTQYRIDISSFKLEEGNIATDWTPGTNKGLFNMYTTKNDQGEVQSSIAIKGNTISIESDNFTLSNEGDITAISGKIGGWDIKLNSLVSQVATPKSEIKCFTIVPSEAEYSIDGIEYKKADVDYIYKIPFSNVFVSGYYYYTYMSGSGYDIWITTPVPLPGVTKTQIEIGYWHSIKYKYIETEDSAQYQDMDTDKCYTYQKDENSVKSYYYYRDDQWVVETADPNYIVQLYGSGISNNIITAKSQNNNGEFFNIGKNGHIMCQNIKTPSITTNNNCITVSTITEKSTERTNFMIGGQVVTIAGDENYRDIIQSNGGFLLRAGDGTKNWIAFAAAGYNFTNGDINVNGIKANKIEAASTTTNLTANTTVCINNKYYNLSQILTWLNDDKKINFT